ncbi:MAG: ATP-binding protein, partial [Hyphomonas sp.]
MSEADPKPVTFLDRWTRLSLARRIMLAAAIWGLIVLIGGALALSALYRAQTLSLLSDELDQTLITLTRDMTREGAFLADGRVTDDNHVFLSTDSRYQTQYSGRYWAIVAVDKDGDPVGDLRSRSLWDEPVPMSPRLLKRALATPGTTQFGIGPGP